MTAAGPKPDRAWTIGFDADDTLWHNERLFRDTQDQFTALLADHADITTLSDRLLAAERRNLNAYGFGVKGFVLSMIETAIEVTDGTVPASVISDLLAQGRHMLTHPVDLLPGVRDTIEALSPRAEIVLITKGDLLHQERKLAQSGLGDLFDAVEIVSEKTPQVYARIFARHTAGGAEGNAMMVGNSLRSDVIPALDAGAWGVHVPHDLTWAMEHAEKPQGHPRFREIAALDVLVPLFDEIR